MRSFLSSILILFSLITRIHSSTDCLTTEIRETLISTISNWYFAQIDGVKFADSIEDFNPNIDDIFKCDGELDICIGSNTDCSIGEYDSCKQFKSQNNGYWRQFKDILIGITFGQIDFECGGANGIIIARLTKTIYLKEGIRFNDDLFEFECISSDYSPVECRAILWSVYARDIDPICNEDDSSSSDGGSSDSSDSSDSYESDGSSSGSTESSDSSESDDSSSASMGSDDSSSGSMESSDSSEPDDSSTDSPDSYESD